MRNENDPNDLQFSVIIFIVKIIIVVRLNWCGTPSQNLYTQVVEWRKNVNCCPLGLWNTIEI
jgi:hypothetical protein